MASPSRCRHPQEDVDFDTRECRACGEVIPVEEFYREPDDRTPADHYLEAVKARREDPRGESF